MKFVAVILAVIAATAVQAAAVPQWCSHPGQGCYMLKRAAGNTFEVKRSAEALAEAFAEAEPQWSQWCSHPGQGCEKVKRAAAAIDEVKRSAAAVADAFASLDEE